MSEFLFSEFESVSVKQWKQKIQVDLKGADYNDTLVWQSPEGIHVKPFYHSEHLDKSVAPIPGQPDLWRVAQRIFIDDEAIANRLALDALSRGAEAIYFRAEKTFDFEVLFKDVRIEEAAIYFDLEFLNQEFLNGLATFFKGKAEKVYFQIDPIGKLARTGNWFNHQKSDHESLAHLIHHHPNTNWLGVDVSLYQNAGANAVQQLAYALAHANEYLNHFDHLDRTSNPEKEFNPPGVGFKMSIGSNYFFEIAKLRALRKLYAVLATEYGRHRSCHILAEPTRRNKTLYDFNLNMLRTTTECMSAVVGGADTICNLAYDGIYHKSNEFGERISRNQLLVLKAESYFDWVSNPADGSYYIETLTKELSEKALTLFKDIEQNGGFLKQLQEGTIQKKIKESAEKEQKKFDQGDIILVGTNKYKNSDDRMKDQLELYPFVKVKPRKTLIAPIITKRLAEALEQERLKDE